MLTLVRSFLPILIAGLFSMPSWAQQDVILLHGLCRTPRSMKTMEKSLVKAGYRVTNVGYPSRTAQIKFLSEKTIGDAIQTCRQNKTTKIHFVTHSMGGILVRSYMDRHEVPEIGHVVMIAPPNQGSEVVDKIGSWWIFKKLNGPAGAELGTVADSVPNTLGAVHFSLGVIAGNRSINWINSFLIPGTDDGKVSIERTQIAGMADHIVVKATHPFVSGKQEVIRQTIAFLRTGSFEKF